MEKLVWEEYFRCVWQEHNAVAKVGIHNLLISFQI